MLPPKTDQRWTALVTGTVTHKFGNAAASMLIFQIKATLKRDPSPATIRRCVDEFHAFCTKYERMLQADIADIFKN